MSAIKKIGMDDLDRLGIDDSSHLYWDGKPLVTEERIVLGKLVNAAVFFGGIGAFLTSIVETLKFFGFGHP